MKRFLQKGENKFPVVLSSQLQAHVNQETIIDELRAAMEFLPAYFLKQVDCHLHTPAGVTTAVLTAADIKSKLNQQGENARVSFSGTVFMLDSKLEARVRPPTELDLGRMRHLTDELQSLTDITSAIGSISVLASSITETMTNIVCLERDVERDVMFLAMYWHRDHPDFLVTLAEQLRNLTFMAELGGSGSDLYVERFRRVEKEESKKNVLGMSAYRKALMLRDLVAAAAVDRNGRSDAQLASDLLTTKKELAVYQVDTCSRYLTAASRMTSDAIGRLMMKWEFQFKRAVLVDGIMILRAVLSATTTDAELLALLQCLFHEQVCRVRPQLPVKGRMGFDAVSIARGLCLRQTFIQYLKQSYSHHASAIDKYGTWRYYEDMFGMTESGTLATAIPDDPVDAPVDLEQPDASTLTKFPSKASLIKLLDAVMQNKHELAFAALAKHNGSSTGLDMTYDSMRTLQAKDQAIRAEYVLDFPPAVAPMETAVVQVGSPGSGSGEVRLSNAVTSGADYDIRLTEYNKHCQASEDPWVFSFGVALQ